ncbi:MAG: hypothetical protein KJO69_11100 [Gammaproteobacteria bacterium]|nr:hypothetical protein [Gammaproteobacteria bacterium]
MLNYYPTNTKKVVVDGNDIYMELGAKPKKVEVVNLTTGAYGLWTEDMNDNELLVLLAGTGGSGGTGMKIANGISIQDSLEDVDGNMEPLTVALGALADFNDTALEELSFVFSY